MYLIARKFDVEFDFTVDHRHYTCNMDWKCAYKISPILVMIEVRVS